MLKENSAPSKAEIIWKATAIFLVLVYLVNCLTPLRLHVDMLRYYAIKDCIEYGCPPDSEAAKDYLPYGYTALLLILSKLGILKSFTIVLLNCVFLFASLYLINKIFKKTIHPFLFVTLVLLNWTILKFAAHPLSEMQYLFFSTLSIYYFFSYTQTKKLKLLLPSLIFCAAAFLTRTVGITLVGAIALGLIWEYRKQLILLIKSNRIIVGVLIAIMIGVSIFSKQLGLTHYTSVFSKQFQEGLGIRTMLDWHFTEWSEITLNTSIVKIAAYLPSSLGSVLFIALGIAFFAFFLYVLFIRKNSIPFIVKAYLALYSLLMFNWPFYDPRFWVPLVPFIVAVLLQADFSKSLPQRIVSRLFTAVYMLAGVIAIGFFTYTSLNKEKFAQKQANGVYRNEYETHFFGKVQTDTAKKIDPVILNVLKRYD
jgi:hypothetical protein